MCESRAALGMAEAEPADLRELVPNGLLGSLFEPVSASVPLTAATVRLAMAVVQGVTIIGSRVVLQPLGGGEDFPGASQRRLLSRRPES